MHHMYFSTQVSCTGLIFKTALLLLLLDVDSSLVVSACLSIYTCTAVNRHRHFEYTELGPSSHYVQAKTIKNTQTISAMSSVGSSEKKHICSEKKHIYCAI